MKLFSWLVRNKQATEKSDLHFDVVGDGVAVLNLEELKKDNEFTSYLKEVRKSVRPDKEY